MRRLISSLKMRPNSVFFISFIAAQLFGTVHSDNDTVVNILFVYEDLEQERIFNASLTYFKEHPNLKIKIGKVRRFEAKIKDEKPKPKFCKVIDGWMKDGEMPDVAIDFTREGAHSEGIRLALKTIQMPTISTAYGQEGVFRMNPIISKEWKDLDNRQSKYLIQISPPADVMMQSIRSIWAARNISCAFTYDAPYYRYTTETIFSSDYGVAKSKSKSEIYHSDPTGIEVIYKIRGIAESGVTNIFTAGNLTRISETLNLAAETKSAGVPYFNDTFSWYSLNMVVGDTKLPSCAECQSNISLVHLIPEALGDSKRKNLLSSTLIVVDLTLTQLFYFDVALDTVLAVAAMKKGENFKSDISNHTCGNGKMNSYPSSNLDLMAAFKKTTVDNSLPVHLEKNGKNYPEFKVGIYRLLYEANSTKPKSNKKLGTWTAGFAKQALIQLEKGKMLN